jgi:hypothetical protein
MAGGNSACYASYRVAIKTSLGEPLEQATEKWLGKESR